MRSQAVSAMQLREWLHDGNEIAVLDVRDGGPYSRSHILAASNMPLASIEILANALVPNRKTRIVLCDENELLADKAAKLLIQNGFEDVHVLTGGIAAWQNSGFPLFSGNGIISKAFGECVEEYYGTPHITPDELQKWKTEKRNFLHLDTRPIAEYKLVSIPGAVDCPGAEIVYRVQGLLDSDETPIVVNCAGRTRSIIGVQSLRNAGVKNPVFALKNGTMGWHLAGLLTESGSEHILDVPNEDGLRAAQAAADALAKHFDVQSISLATLKDFIRDLSRTTYVFDVRQPDEFVKGHIPRSLNVPGGQLIQATDVYAAVRNARIVLVDEHRVQSVITAHWLMQMGWKDVFVLDIEKYDLNERGPASVIPLVSPIVQGIAVTELEALISNNTVVVVDVGESYWYRQGRIPRSFYAMRSRLGDAVARFDKNQMIAVTDSEGRLAAFAAMDLMNMGFKNVRYVLGGRSAWRKAGYPSESIGDETDEFVLTDTDDMWYPPWARKSGVEEAMMQYLSWEVDLMKTVSQETYVKFKLGTQ